MRDLAAPTPGLTISDTGPGSTGSIMQRGPSASDVNDGGSNYDDATGVYMGEVPLYYDFKLLDLERVETLLGPQGTLYCLGTMAGAIRYIPARPNVTDIEGEVHGRFYGKDHSDKLGYQADGVINLPIVTDHIASRSATGITTIRASSIIRRWSRRRAYPCRSRTGRTSFPMQGYDANLYALEDLNFERTFSTRNQLLFQTTEDLKLILTYAYQRTKTEGGSVQQRRCVRHGQVRERQPLMEPVDRSAHLVSAELNANIADIVDVVATTAYTEVKTDEQNDNTDLLLDLDYDYELFPAFTSWNETQTKRKQYNQEIRLVSRHGGPFRWVLGGFYNENKYQSDYAEHRAGPDFRRRHLWHVIGDNPEELEYVSYVTSKVTEKAIFGEGTFEMTPEWQVTAGARYFNYTLENRRRGDPADCWTVSIRSELLAPTIFRPPAAARSKDGWVRKFNTSTTSRPT